MEGSEEDQLPLFSVEEWHGSSGTKLSRTAVVAATSTKISIDKSIHRLDELWKRILGAFVPEGFPGCVTPDYVPFQVWDSLQGLSTYIRSMLSTHALLSAIGVGEKSATVIGATFQWFLRDFTGMLGGILFTFYQGSSLDSDAKMWRLVADFMNDLGMVMDLVSPLYPSAFVFILCLGSLSRSFKKVNENSGPSSSLKRRDLRKFGKMNESAGVASGATRAALTQHFALANNAADISAKEGSQETLATMVGMLLGMLLAHLTMGNPLVIWISFLVLTIFHMYANYKAVRCLCLSTLNNERSLILLWHFMSSGQALSPQQVSKMEHVLPFWISAWCSMGTKLVDRQIHLGVRVSSLTYTEIKPLLGSAGAHYRQSKYLLLERQGVITVVTHKDSTSADILQSYIHALVFVDLLGKHKSAHAESRAWMNRHYNDFMAKLRQQGWNTERLLSPSVVWRASWTFGSSDEKIN